MTPEKLREKGNRWRELGQYDLANIYNQHAAALEEIERLKKEAETLRSLYNAKHPPHERRKCSTAHDGPIESFEELSSQSHWPECQCYECRAIFVMNQEHERAEKAERRAERLKDYAEVAMSWIEDKHPDEAKQYLPDFVDAYRADKGE